VISLSQHGIPACYLTSSQTDATVWNRAINGEFALIYMYVFDFIQCQHVFIVTTSNVDRAPERVASWSEGIDKLVAKGITAFAIDESHCISGSRIFFEQSYGRQSKD
jgi:superfamily II DNA helicase RecQ